MKGYELAPIDFEFIDVYFHIIRLLSHEVKRTNIANVEKI